MDLRGNLSRNLRLIRGSCTQAEFSQILGITRATLQSIEQGQAAIRLDTLETICRRLDIPAAVLLSDEWEGARPDVLLSALQTLDWIASLSQREQQELRQWLRQTLELWDQLDPL